MKIGTSALEMNANTKNPNPPTNSTPALLSNMIAPDH